MRIGRGFAFVLSMFMMIVSLTGYWLYANITQELPSLDRLPFLLEPPNGILLQPTRLYDRTYEHVILTLENPAVHGEQYLHVELEERSEKDKFSQNLIDATIAWFDPDFWEHPGYTLDGLSEGTHPTIAQQLISDLVLDGEPASLKRNIRERLLAAQVTDKFGREKILEWYLNSAQYGEMIYGADAASHAYFGKSARSLNLAEAAILTLMAENPAINPTSGMSVLSTPLDKVLQAMVVKGSISVSDAGEALREAIVFQRPAETQSIATAFTELVLKQLNSVIPLDRVLRGGYEIVTSLDYDLQLQAICASKIQVARIQGVQEEISNLDGVPCEAAPLLPSIQSNLDQAIQDVTFEVIILEPDTGQVLTMVGGNESGMDATYPIKHPAGTILSPFLYLTAFARGMSPATLLWDIPNNKDTEIESDLKELHPSTFESFNGPVRLRMAMVNDYSATATGILQQVGIENVWLTEKSFGITIPETDQISETKLSDLYTQPVTLLEGVYAYAVLANQGTMAGRPAIREASDNDPYNLNPSFIQRVLGVDGKVWLDWSSAQSRPIISPQLAYLATNVLSDENARRASLGHPNSLEIGRPAGAKVGLIIDGSGVWTIGYIPQLVIGVWAGRSQEDTTRISPEMTTGVWHALIEYATNQTQVLDFPKPPGISLVQVCDPSGLLISDSCPTIVQEIFLVGNEPTQVDNLYQKYYVNRETGSLATVFTPSDMVEEKIYLVIPPQANAWAEAVGLPIPPETVDVIYPPQSGYAGVQITFPQMFDIVKGKIDIIGSAAGDDFSYYRLQVGKGINPQKWFQISGDVDQVIHGDLLGTWDTESLEGDYVLQLLVVRQDSRIEQAFLPVTIDNTLPHVQVLAPEEREEYGYQTEESILIQVSARDNLGVERVEFYVDNELESTLYQPPFIIIWPKLLGKHMLTIRAYDLAGNLKETTIPFSVNK